MKTAALGLVLTLTASAWPITEQSKTDRQQDGFQGEVYAVREADQAVTIKGQPTPPSDRHTTIYYDKAGNRTLKLDYNGGRMVERTTFSRQGHNETIEKIESGGQEARPSSTSSLNAGPSPARILRHSFKYDGNGFLAEESVYTDQGDLVHRINYTYGKQGRLLETLERRGPSLTRGDKTTFSYNDTSSQLSSSTWESESQIRTKSTYTEFDANGNWTKKVVEPLSNMGIIREVGRTITYFSPGMAEGVPLPGESPGDLLQPRVVSVPQVVRKSGGVLQQMAIRRIEPVYPAGARAQGITGSVVVEVRVDTSGNVASAEALSGPPGLREAALAAARQWKFQVTRLSGIPVNVIGTITFNFMM